MGVDTIKASWVSAELTGADVFREQKRRARHGPPPYLTQAWRWGCPSG
jgi:hypothetical protein